MKAPLKTRFLAKVSLPNSNGCMLWTAGTFSDGYGVFQNNGRAVRAHRFAFELWSGEIPDGKLVLHSCDVPTCVAPGHLRTGTVKENSSDMLARGRHGTKGRRKTHCKRGHELNPSNTYLFVDKDKYVGRQCLDCRKGAF